MRQLDFSKPVSFSIIKQMLESREFTQLALSQQKQVSLGQVNKIVKYLLERGYIEKGKSAYAVTNPLAIVEEVARQRRMKQHIIGKFSLVLDEATIINMFKKQAIFCLDTALKQYCKDIVSGRVCAYIGNIKKELVEELDAMKGNATHLYVYKPDLPICAVEISGVRYTDKIRTVIDMVCDNSTFAASKLFEEVWGQKIM